MKLIALPFEKPNKVCAGHMKQLKNTTPTKMQTAFSRMTAALYHSTYHSCGSHDTLSIIIQLQMALTQTE